LALIAAGAGAPACSSTHEPGATDGIPIEDLEDVVRAAICAQIEACGGFDTLGPYHRLMEASAAGCEATAKSLLGAVRSLQREVHEGTVLYDPVQARACIDARAAHCSIPVWHLSDEDVAACRAAFTGTIAASAACEADLECAGDAWCDAPDACGGICRTRTPISTSCTDSRACQKEGLEHGSRCRLDPSGVEPGRCVEVRIAAEPAGSGDACGVVDVTGDVETLALCGPNLFCTDAGVCSTPREPGAACAGGEPCVVGYRCSGGADGSTSCQPFTIQNTAGAVCDDVAVICDPFDRLECAGGVCISLGDGSDGSGCEPGFDACLVGLRCSALTRTCGAPKPAGSACATNEECEDGLACVGDPATCVVPACA